jgi:ribosomal protein S18 acetylase RimI-like enzyme
MAVDYRLVPRLLTAEDAPWLQRFHVGEEWWSHEITDFIRDQAFDDQQQGLSTTTLFSFPGLQDVIGFCTAASGGVPVNHVGPVITLPSTFAATRVPAVIIPYFGVGRQYRRLGHYGQEIHLRLLEGIAEPSWAAVRLLYLECWEQNKGGLAFWEKLGYLRVSRYVRNRTDNDEPEYLWRLVYDRFAITGSG